MKKFLSILFLLVTANCFAQNLVINPSFEDYEDCPNISSQLFPPDHAGPFNVNDWYQAGFGTSDYFNACSPGVYGVPSTGFGYQDAKEGSAFVGGIASVDEDAYQEYVQGKLTAPLITGHNIYASYWTVVASSIFMTYGGAENLGALFTNDYIYDSTLSEASGIPQIGSPLNYVFTDTVNWEQVAGFFTASGGEQWITIGGFPILGDPEEELAMVYVYYDDVCVLDLEGAPSSTAVYDTFACPGNPATIAAADADRHYLWDDGSQLQTRTVTMPGTYWVRKVNYNACSFSVDTFRVTARPATVPINLGNDTTMCAGHTIRLNSYNSNFETYKWNTGDTTASINVTAPGLYYVTAAAPCYIGTDTILTKPVAVPEVTLPDDTVVCKGTAVDLHYYQQGNHYYWSTGSEECCITVDEPGIYSLTLTNICGDSDIDEIDITQANCDYCILAPTAFSPNDDGLNDLFEVNVSCPMKNYKLSIFNRWGQIVFSTVNPDRHWDGMINGKTPGNIRVYFYYIEATPAIDGLEKIVKKGDVTLVR